MKLKKAVLSLIFLLSLTPLAFAKGQLYIDAGNNKIYLNDSYVGTGSKLLDLDPRNYQISIRNKYDQLLKNELVNIRENETTRIEIAKSDNIANDLIPLQIQDDKTNYINPGKANIHIDLSPLNNLPQATNYTQNTPPEQVHTEHINLELAPYALASDLQKPGNLNLGYNIGMSYYFNFIGAALNYVNINNQEMVNFDLRLKIYTNYLFGGINFETNDQKSYKLGIGIPVLPFLNGEIGLIRKNATNGFLAKLVLVL